MSTKIYNGFRIGCPIDLLYDRMIGVQKGFQDIADDQVRSYLARRACEVYDLAQLKPTFRLSITTSGMTPLSLAWDDVRDFFAQAEKGLRAYLDFDSSLSLFPAGQTVMVIAHIESREQLDLLKSLKWGDDHFQDFGYWDNTDPPDGVTHVVWRQRRRAWDKTLGPTMTPAIRGLKMTLSRNIDCRINIDTGSLADHLPSTAERAKSVQQIMPQTARLKGDDAIEKQLEIEALLKPVGLQELITKMY